MSGDAYRWPRTAMIADYWRSGVGFSVSFLIALFVPVVSLAFLFFAVLAVIFGLYLAQTVLRANTTLRLDPDGLSVSGVFGTTMIRWDALDHFALRYYTLRRDKEAGWLDLKLRSPAASISLDDRVGGFRAILDRAWEAARARDIGISSSTYANLTAAGLLPKSPPQTGNERR
jgi:hypothetical protein